MKRLKIKTFLLLGVVTLLVTLSLLLVIEGRSDFSQLAIPDLETDLIRDASGWSAINVPVADTQEMREAVDELLNYDAGLYRVYRKGNLELGVYVAYWRPGKMHYRLIHGHNPDVCWVGAGWKITSAWNGRAWHVEGSLVLKPAQYREMTLGNKSSYILFWHLLDGESFSYDRVGRSPIWSFIRDLWERGLDQNAEQWVIRVSSNVPFEELESDPGFQEIMSSLAELGLREDSPPENSEASSQERFKKTGQD